MELYQVGESVTGVDAARVDRRAQIAALEAHMVAMPDEDKRPDVLVPTHYFAHGVYGRQMDIPAGVMVVGKIHKFSQITVLLKGDLTLYTEFGTERFQAPHVTETPPGVKRVAYAHSDVSLITFHGTHETDPDVIEAQIIAPSYEALDGVERAEIAV